jgi:hypothetical protein
MEKDKNYNPRDILKALKKRNAAPIIYEWRVQIHRPVEEILDMIQNRSNPDYQPTKEPYAVTANFHTVDEAVAYAYMARLRGMRCEVINNWTQDTYAE